MTERWLPIPGYEGRYEVSDLGRVKSLPRIEIAKNGHRRVVKGCILKQCRNCDGYPYICLRRRGGNAGYATVHRLVALTFHGDKRTILHNEVAHLDGDCANPRADNLKWVSKIENHWHKRAHGTHGAGEKHPRAKLTTEQALAIKAARGRYSEIARSYQISGNTVSDIKRGRRWKHLPIAIAEAR